MEIKRKNSKKPTVSHINDSPKWLIGNNHLYEGYRIEFSTIRANLKSLFIKHNELMNIWTHLLGALFFFSLFIYIIVQSPYPANIYNELKNDMSNLHFTDNIKKNYQKNILPLIKKIRKTGDKLGEIKIKNFKDNFLSSLIEMEERYIESLKHLIDELKQKEIEFLIKFEMNLEIILKQIQHLKEKINSRFEALIHIVNHNLEDNLHMLEKLLHPDYFINKISQTIDLNLEIYPILIFMLCAFFCLSASTIYHTFYVISPTVNKYLLRLDSSGIVFLIYGSIYAVLYYYFYCDYYIRMFYIIMLSSISITVFVISMCDFIYRPEYLKLKGFLYAGLGLSSIVPVSHSLILGFFSNENNDLLPINGIYIGLFLMAFFYLFGFYIYIKRFPERYYPKTFDIWFNSHTIWHIFVFLAALTHFITLLYLYQFRKSQPCKAHF